MVFRRRKLTNRLQTLIDEMLHVLRHEPIDGWENNGPRPVQLTRLEPRVLMSAAPLAIAAEAMSGESLSADDSDGTIAILAEENEHSATGSAISGSSEELIAEVRDSALNDDERSLAADAERGPELIVIDYRVQEADTLLENLLDVNRDVRLLRLDGNSDGISQITRKLDQIGNVAAIHLLTHGRDGEILLGSSRVNADTLALYAPDLLSWQHRLTADADLLLYACDVAESAEGKDFVESLRELTGADVAASTDGTGSRILGGDWQFEYQAGVIDSSVTFTADVHENWNGLLATLVVTNTNDSGGGSLRQAILDANLSPGPDTITFNISDNATGHFYYQDDLIAGSLSNVIATSLDDVSITDFDPDYPFLQHSWFRIDLDPASGPLVITDEVFIDGYSQPGATQNNLIMGQNANLRIELTSSAADGQDGLDFLAGASGSTVRGLVINGFDYAGIWTDPGVNNVTIQGNFLGTDITGTMDFGNGDGGVHLRSSGNLVGGPNPADRNVISGNDGSGVVTYTFGPIAMNNVVENNYVGVDATGLRALGNSMSGIQVYNQNNMQIRDNVISGNAADAVWLRAGSNNSGTIIQGNLIGLGADGVAAIGNGSAGILVESGSNATTIGGVLPGESNTIAFNATDGVAITNGTAATVRGNAIFSNGGLGIDLNNDGVTSNDLLDIDSGPNGLQNFPVLSNAVVDGTDLTVAGTLSTDLLISGILDFYWSGLSDPSGHGESQSWIGSANINSGLTGVVGFNETFAGVSVPVGAFITATMTDSSGNTSEFSVNQTVAAANTAPVLDSTASPVLAATIEDAGSPVGPVGTLVSSLVDPLGGGGLDNISDSDAGSQQGIVVTAADASNGTWWYSTNNGSTWNALGAVSWNSARLLAADAVTRLYFQPNPDWNGTVVNGITFHAWDRTSGTAGGTTTLNFSSVLDQFNSVSYSNNDGTQNWSSNWAENDSNGGGDNGGRIHVSGNRLDVRAKSVGDSIYREADLSGATSATLSFDFSNTLNGLDRIDVQVSGNGGASYSTVATLNQSQSSFGSMNIDISSYIASDTRVRFYVSGSDGEGHGRFDNVNISYSADTGGTTAFSINSDSASITVNPVNDVPVITSGGGGASASVSVSENVNTVTTVVSTDPDEQSLTYSITGGDDAARFTMNSATGLLRFITSPNFEAPTDVGADNVYDVTIQVSDGTLTDSQQITVTVTPVNDNNPMITSNGGGSSVTMSIAENTTAVTTVTATDADLPVQTLTYSITGGLDAALFTIDSSTGVLRFIAPPNAESPNDTSANNFYHVSVEVSDGTRTDLQDINIRVTDVDEFDIGSVNDVSAVSNSVNENSANGAVVGVTARATDSDASSAINYSLDDNAGGRFAIHASTGVVTVANQSLLNFESAVSHGIVVRATSTDGSSSTANFLISVRDVNEAPSIANQSFSVAENSPNGTLTGTVLASDVDAGANGLFTYAITGGNGAAIFAINAVTGMITVADSNQLNYEAYTSRTLQVTATDGGTPRLSTTATVTINLLNVNETPTISAISDRTILEADDTGAILFSVEDPETAGGSLIVTAVSGDQSLIPNANLVIAGSGASKNITVTPLVGQTGGPVTITVTVSDGVLQTQETFQVTVVPRVLVVTTTLDENNGDTTDILSLLANPGGLGISLREAIIATNNTNAGSTPDVIILPAGNYVLSRGSGDDSASNGDLDIKDDVLITGGGARSTIIDGNNLDRVFDIRNSSVSTITDITVRQGRSNEGAIGVSSGAVLNLTDVTVRDSTGTDKGGAAKVSGTLNLNRVTLTNNTANEGGALYFGSADGGSLNNVTISGNTAATMGGGIWTDKVISVTSSTIANNAAPLGAGIFVMDAEDVVLTNSILDNFGSNSNLQLASGDFNIDSDGSALLAGIHDLVDDPLLLPFANNGGATDTHFLYFLSPAINPVGLTGAPAIDQRGSARDATPDIGAFEFTGGPPVGPVSDVDPAVNQVSENTADGSLVGIVASANDPAGSDTVSFSLDDDAGGRFGIDGSTGVVTVVDGSLLDYENATSHSITVRATSSDTSFSRQLFTIAVLPIDDNSPLITSDGGGNSANLSAVENSATITTVTATDADLPTQSLQYVITGGLDAAKFMLDISTGTLLFSSLPNYEMPTDNGGNNTYEVIVQVSDGNGGRDTQAITVTVTNLNEAPVAQGNSYSLNEDTSLTVSAAGVLADDTDVDGNTLSAVLVSNVSSGQLTLNASGSFTYVANANFSGSDSFTYRATDGSLNSNVVTVSIIVNPLNDAPTVSLANTVLSYVEQASPLTLDSGLSISDVDNAVLTGASVTIAGGLLVDADELLFTPIAGIVGAFNAATDTLTFTGSASVSDYQTVLRSVKFRNLSDAPFGSIRTLTFTVTDGTASGTNSRNLQVTAVNDPPTMIAATFSIGENSASGIVVGVATASDPDAGDTRTFAITAGNTAGAFAINGSTGTITVANPMALDFEKTPVFSLTIRVVDSGGRQDAETVTIQLTDVNDSPTITSNGGGAAGSVNVFENTLAVTTVRSTDADGDVVRYSIVGGVDQALFSIDRVTGQLSFIIGQDFESPGDSDGDRNYAVIFQVSDGNGGMDNQTLNVRLINANETPLSATLASILVAEDSTASSIHVASAFVDPDGDPLSFGISQITMPKPLFRSILIDATSGIIHYELRPNAFGSAVIQIRATDAGGQFADLGFSFTVQPVNDAPRATGQSFQTTMEQTLDVSAPGLLTTAFDVDGDALQMIILQAPLHGTLISQSDGRFTYAPSANYSGSDAFHFAVTDGTLVSGTVQALIYVYSTPLAIPVGQSSSSAGTTGTVPVTGSDAPSDTSASTSTGAVGAPVGTGPADGTVLPGAVNVRPSSEKSGRDVELSALGTAIVDQEFGSGIGWNSTLGATTVVTAGPAKEKSHGALTSTGSRSESLEFNVESIAQTAMTSMEARRDIVYRQLMQEGAVLKQLNSFEQELSASTQMSPVVVGSVGVVGTGLSVGYLIWIVRLGTIISGLLAQVPAWSMLDPLLVVDERDQDEDQESIQTIVDEQHSRLSQARSVSAESTDGVASENHSNRNPD